MLVVYPATHCTPSTHGGYPSSRTTYSSGMLRTFNILIEISNAKNPSNLGAPVNLLSPNGPGNGYVSRCLRQSILAIDLVEPNIRMERVNDQKLSRDLVPNEKRKDRSCKDSK